MAKKKQHTTKRRVAAQQQAEKLAERQRAAATKALRRRQIVVGVLALALIAPLAFAGFVAASGGNDDPEVQIPTTAPTTTIDFGWVADEFRGVELTGETPCPATDGTAERTTGFAQAPELCIDVDADYELRFDVAPQTLDGVALPPLSIEVPLDPDIDADAANLAAVLAWYRAYEQTIVQAFATGLIGLGGVGDAGFLVEPTPSAIPVEERYVPGAVLATPFEDGLNGALLVVVDETGQAVLEQTSDFVRVGTITDVEALVDAYEALSAVAVGDLALIDSVTVTETG